MPKIVKASLVKLKTKDGIMEMADHIPLFKKYRINLDTITMKKGVNIKTGQHWEREMVIDVETGEWFPTELLEWKSNA